jgi:hypothetical protein
LSLAVPSLPRPAEAGDRSKAFEISAKAADDYATAAKQFLKERWLPNLRKQFSEVESDAPREQIARANAELDGAGSSITAAKPDELFLIIDKLKAIDQLFYPPFFRVPPSHLQMADYVLQVIRYEKRRWDFHGVYGIGRFCVPRLHQPRLSSKS